MALTINYSPLYSVNTDLKKNKKNSGVVKSYNTRKKNIPMCVCFVCKKEQPTKNLSKENRKKYKSKVHPICNQCRKRLNSHIPVYKEYLNSYYNTISSMID